MLGTEAVQYHLPALVHHGQLDGVPVADVTRASQECGEGQQSRFHWLVASRLRAIAVGQRLLQICVEQLMAMLAQKHKTSASYGCVRLFSALPRSTRWRVPHNGLLKVEGARGFFTYQDHRHAALVDPLRAAI